ncbi:Uncharacterised protein [Acinetobacter baumannii]|nr:Uncharacterised protein [Acinetobacter baumannii]
MPKRIYFLIFRQYGNLLIFCKGKSHFVFKVDYYKVQILQHGLMEDLQEV